MPINARVDTCIRRTCIHTRVHLCTLIGILKLEVLKTCVLSGMLYGCDAWTITKVAEAKILALERKCYRKILRIGWMQKVTNAELYRRIGLTENLIQKNNNQETGTLWTYM